jgi:hypothetical protein
VRILRISLARRADALVWLGNACYEIELPHMVVDQRVDAPLVKAPVTLQRMDTELALNVGSGTASWDRPAALPSGPFRGLVPATNPDVTSDSFKDHIAHPRSVCCDPDLRRSRTSVAGQSLSSATSDRALGSMSSSKSASHSGYSSSSSKVTLYLAPLDSRPQAGIDNRPLSHSQSRNRKYE